MVIGCLLPSVSHFLYQRLRVRPRFSQVFPIDRKRSINCIIPTLENSEFVASEYIDFTTPLEAVVNVQYINTMMGKLNLKKDRLQVIFSRGASQNDMEQNVILIGGPIHNSWTNEFIKAKSPKLRFDEFHLTSDFTQNAYQARIEDNKVVKDYVLFCVTQNPWNSKAKAILAAGCRGYGSIGLLKFIENDDIVALVHKHPNFRRNNELYCVFSFDIHHSGQHTFTFSNLRCEELTALKGE